MTNITVLISGSGSNLQALIDNPQIGPNISLVISSSAKAYGLERAAKAGIPTKVHTLYSYTKSIPKEDKEARLQAREQFNKDLAGLIINQSEEYKPDLVVCAGWMLIFGVPFLQPLEQAKIPIINLHPALPGAFAGINAIERAYEAGQKGEIAVAGVMIHYVIAAVDEGEPIVVKEIPFIKGETLEQYTERVHSVEHIAIVEGTLKALSNSK